MRQRAGDLEGVVDGDEGLALQAAADELDEVVGQMGEIAEGLVADAIAVAKAAAQQMGVIDLAVVAAGRCDDVNWAISLRHAGKSKPIRPTMSITLVTTNIHPKHHPSPKNLRNFRGLIPARSAIRLATSD